MLIRLIRSVNGNVHLLTELSDGLTIGRNYFE